MNSFSSNFKSGIFAFPFPLESLGLSLHHLEEREQTHGVLKRRKGQLLARADFFQVPLHRVKSSQHFPGSIQQFAGMGSQDLGHLMNFNKRNHIMNGKHQITDTFLYLNWLPVISEVQLTSFTPSPVAELCGDDRRIWIVECAILLQKLASKWHYVLMIPRANLLSSQVKS